MEKKNICGTVIKKRITLHWTARCFSVCFSSGDAAPCLHFLLDVETFTCGTVEVSREPVKPVTLSTPSESGETVSIALALLS